MAVTNVRNIDLGLYLKIVSRGAVYNTLNQESALWELMTRKLKKDAEVGGEVRGTMRKSYGAAAAQFVPTTNGAYPAGQKSQLAEYIGYYKDFSVAIEVPITLLKKAEKDVGAYGKPVAEEVEAKGIAMARVLSSSVPQDGTGIIGTVSTATVDSGSIVVKLKTGNSDRGHIGWFFEDDKLLAARDNTGEESATVNGGTAVSYFKVSDIDRQNDQATLAAYNSSDAQITVTSLSGTDLKASDFLRRFGSNWVNGASVSGDYGTLGYQWAGLESLGHDDGRTVNNITMSGALKGTRFSAQGALIDPSHIQSALSQTKTRVGQRRYKYKGAYMAPETYDSLVEERETDRRFQTVTDNARGVASLKFIHRQDNLEYEVDDFVRKDRIHILPEGDVLCFNGSDFDYVRQEGSGPWHLKPGTGSNAGQYMREQVAFMEGCGLFFTQHSAALCTIHDFRLS